MQHRRVSFTSINIIAGCMPEKVKLEDPTITVIFKLESLPKKEDLMKDVKKLFQYHRLTSVPVGEPRTTSWIFEKVDVDPEMMIRSIEASSDTEEELARIVQEQRYYTLRKTDVPWWEFCLISNTGSSGHVVLFRIDHGIADGLSLATVFSDILTNADGSKVSIIPKSMVSNKTIAQSGMLKTILKIPMALFTVATQPLGKCDDPIVFSKNVVGKNVIDHRRQKLILFEPIPLDFVKKIKDKAGVSLNDVMLAAWAHAVREYCALNNCSRLDASRSRDILFRVMMTHGFPHKKSSNKSQIIQNGWVPLSLKLPIGSQSIKEKLSTIVNITSKLKAGPIAYVQLMLQNRILKYLPISLSRLIVYNCYAKRSMTFTNVPGPQDKILLANEIVDSCSFFVYHLHPVLSILSYNQKINITLAVDEMAVPNAHMIPNCFMNAFVTLGNEFKIDIPSSVLQSAAKVIN